MNSHRPFRRLIDNPQFIVPHLSDLVILWLKDEIGEGHEIVFGEATGCGSSALTIDRKLVCYIYDDTVDLVFDGGRGGPSEVKAADPDFFSFLWRRMKEIDMTIDPLYENYVTTFLEKK